MIIAEQLTHPVTSHGEGPFWDAPHRRLLVLDVLAGAVVELGATNRVSRINLPMSVVTAVRRRRSGGFVISSGSDIFITDDMFGHFERIARVTSDPALRTNDGGCDQLGGFVIGTMAYDERTGAGTVYRVAPDHSVSELLSPVSISNGVQWSADGTRAYYIDTPTKSVDCFDVDPETGSWHNRRVHIAMDDTSGFPDGMAIDEDDGLWVALWGGGAVNHYDKYGRLVDTIQVPGVSQASSCAFGGDAGGTIYITTSRQGLSPDTEPAAGSVFAASTDVRGATVAEFAG